MSASVLHDRWLRRPLIILVSAVFSLSGEIAVAASARTNSRGATPVTATASATKTTASKATPAGSPAAATATSVKSRTPGTAAGRAAAKARGASAAPGAPRRLEDIPIEGEIAVPQVLFITTRDQRRFVDFQHRRYLRTSLQVGETTRFPSWIAVIPSSEPKDKQKETSR